MAIGKGPNVKQWRPTSPYVEPERPKKPKAMKTKTQAKRRVGPPVTWKGINPADRAFSDAKISDGLTVNINESLARVHAARTFTPDPFEIAKLAMRLYEARKETPDGEHLYAKAKEWLALGKSLYGPDHEG